MAEGIEKGQQARRYVDGASRWLAGVVEKSSLLKFGERDYNAEFFYIMVGLRLTCSAVPGQ